jgi:hypothetical protein
MKPSTIRATVAGVQSGRSSADWFIIDNLVLAGGGMPSDGFDVGNAQAGFKKEADPIGEPTESAS